MYPAPIPAWTIAVASTLTCMPVAAGEHVALEMRRDVDHESITSIVHQAVDVA